MNQASFNGSEESVDQLLPYLSEQGLLDVEFTNDDLDQLLTLTSPITLSDSFAHRALTAITLAQNERQKRNPTFTLGAMLAQARYQAQIELTEVATQLGISVKLIEVLEAGQLSVRQILRNFPPAFIAKLLAIINLTAREFTNQLIFLTNADESPASTAAQLTYRSQSSDSTLAVDIAEYVESLERLTYSQ